MPRTGEHKSEPISNERFNMSLILDVMTDILHPILHACQVFCHTCHRGALNGDSANSAASSAENDTDYCIAIVVICLLVILRYWVFG